MTTASSDSPQLGPVQAQERIVLLDVLRGFALFGILFVNHHLTILDVEAFHPSDLSRLGQSLVWVFGLEKFWPLFAVLFGIGLSIQMERAQTRGVAVLPFCLRRLLFLVFLGVVLNFFLLVPYLLHLSVAGVSAVFVGYVLRNRRAISVLAVTIVVLVIFLMNWTASDLPLPELSGPPNVSQEEVASRIEGYRNRVQEESEAAVSWSFPNLAEQVSDYLSFLPNMLRTSIVRYKGRIDLVFYMLLGIFLWRLGVLEQAGKHRRFFMRLFFVAFPVGLGTSIYWVAASNDFVLTIFGLGSYPTPLVRQIWFPIARVASLGMCLSYLAGLALIIHRPFWSRILWWFAPVGRLALTNYALQALLPALVFGEYMPGIPRINVGVWGGMVVLTGLFTIQVVFSRVWLRHFQFGPLEWVWRSLTYWKLQPMRVGAPAAKA
jgi:uncharacterized protein